MSKKNRRNRNMQQSPAEKERARKRELLARELAHMRMERDTGFCNWMIAEGKITEPVDIVVKVDDELSTDIALIIDNGFDDEPEHPISSLRTTPNDWWEWAKRFPCVKPPARRVFFESQWVQEPGFTIPGLYQTGWLINHDLYKGREYIGITHCYKFPDEGFRTWQSGAIVFFEGNGVITSMEHSNGTPMDFYSHEIILPLYVLTLLNTRNIELVDAPAPPPKVAQRYEREFGQPMTRYKVLRVNPVRKVYDRDDDGETDDEKTLRSLHLVRGHFRHNENHPIPQFNGTFWIPSHARGNEQAGITVKDYKVESPDES